MLDSRIVDIHFNSAFFRLADADTVNLSFGSIEKIDKGLASSLKLLRRFVTMKHAIMADKTIKSKHKLTAALEAIEIDNVRVSDLGLDFTLPGFPSIELITRGADTGLTIHNVDLYVAEVVDMTIRKGVIRQIEAFREGFSTVFPFEALKAFSSPELVMLFGCTDEDWSLGTLEDSIKADHGFNNDSKTIQNLLTVLSKFNVEERADFLQFVTGSRRLPIGGFKNLTPAFTVVCKPAEAPHVPDDYLPSVMTCANYLKLPDYSSMGILKTRLKVAVSEGRGAFHLS